jgi:two-component system, NarL family, nitrate/nitrite response regulator NarL
VREPIRIFVVDDHALFREGLLRLLAADETLVVVGSADSVEGALTRLKEVAADVIILDYDLGAETALTAMRGMKESSFNGRVLVVTAGVPNRDALELIRLGVSGIFHKKHSPEELHRGIRDVAEGKVLIDQSYLQTLLDGSPRPQEAEVPLTERDRGVLRLLLQGSSNKEIAGMLNISESAAKAALQQLFAKTGVRTRSQLVRVALEKLRKDL